METTRLSSKDQIVSSKAVRYLHRWGAGTDFAVEDTGDGVLLRPIEKGRITRLEDVAGCVSTQPVNRSGTRDRFRTRAYRSANRANESARMS